MVTAAEHRITTVDVHLVSVDVAGKFADATRTVETLGYAIVRVRTDTGLEGVGFTYHEVGGEALKTMVLKDIAPRLSGADPFGTEVIYRDLVQYLRGVGRKGLAFCALSAVDTALWDLKGKVVGLPLYRLLGGNRADVPVYASGGWTSYDDHELVAEVVGMVEQGYTQVKFKVGVDGGTNLRRDVRRVAAVRDAVGPEVGIMLDANNCWDAATGVQFANRVRDLDIIWLEEPVPADDLLGLARYKRGTDVPLATGEHEYTKYGVRDLLVHEAVDVLQVDGARSGGYTEMLKIAAMAEAWNIRFAPHAMEYLHWHLVSAAPSGLVLERLLAFEDITARIFPAAPLPVQGTLHIPDLPGLGLELDMDFVRAHDET
ncbi:mandelate racemase/muconate lactonizing enzyme family protein [Angustibacter speluncae]